MKLTQPRAGTTFQQDDDGVKPVIAVIIMVTLTFSLALVLYNWVPVHHCNDRSPRAQFELTGNQTVNYTVAITSIDFEISLNETEYYLHYENDYPVPGFQGEVFDITDLEKNETTNISFSDRDGDGMLSVGDQFELKSKENGGVANVGYWLRIADGVTGDTICKPSLTP